MSSKKLYEATPINEMPDKAGRYVTTNENMGSVWALSFFAFDKWADLPRHHTHWLKPIDPLPAPAERGEVCEECNGSGEIEQNIQREGYPEIDVPTVCIYCNGTGKLPQPAPTKQREEGVVKNWKSLAEIYYLLLKRLVEIKDLKDLEGKTLEYKIRQPLAWKSAREALALWDTQQLPTQATEQEGKEAIEFGEWLRDSKYQVDSMDRWFSYDSEHHPTTADLYTLFINRKK